MTQPKRSMAPVGRVPIPTFSSRQEEAEFWDTHDLADYWDEFKPVKARFAKKLSEEIAVRFEPDALQELRAQARAKGIDPPALIAMWVLERLQTGNGAD